MRRTLRGAALVLPLALAFRCEAQPTLTSGDLAYQVGDVYDFIACGPQGFPSTGENLTWYFANLQGTESGSVNIVDPSLTVGAASFPTATAADQFPGFDMAIYYASSATEQMRLGYYAGASEISICSDPGTEMTYPVTYGTTFTDSMVCAESGVYFRTRYGETTITCVGYGTLVLPYGSFTDCLLMHRHWNYLDDYNDLVPGYVDGDSYSFIRAGIHVPLLVMSYSTYTQGDSTIVNQGSSFLSALSTGVVAQAAHAEDVKLAMDPGSGELTLMRKNADPAEVGVFSADGRMITGLRLSAGALVGRFSLAGAQAGVYLVRITDHSGCNTLRVVRE